MESIIVSKKLKKNYNYLFIGTYKSNKMKISITEMRVNDSEMSTR